MSRLHSRRKGSSGSKRPMLTENPKWVTQSSDEVKDLVVKLNGEGMSMAKIGLVLRDQHAVPSVVLATGMSIKAIRTKRGSSPSSLRTSRRS